jgi:hypothetical protein
MVVCSLGSDRLAFPGVVAALSLCVYVGSVFFCFHNPLTGVVLHHMESSH